MRRSSAKENLEAQKRTSLQIQHQQIIKNATIISHTKNQKRTLLRKALCFCGYIPPQPLGKLGAVEIIETISAEDENALKMTYCKSAEGYPFQHCLLFMFKK